MSHHGAAEKPQSRLERNGDRKPRDILEGKRYSSSLHETTCIVSLVSVSSASRTPSHHRGGQTGLGD